MKRITFLLFLTLPIFFVGCTCETCESNAVSIDEAETKAVLERHLAAFASHDIEGIVADYSTDAVIISPDAVILGAEAIRDFFKETFKAFPQGETEFELDKTVIKDDMAYITWHSSVPSMDIPFGTDTFIVHNGKIVRQTFAGVMNMK
jgi:ketosteroid isomerase-like protein